MIIAGSIKFDAAGLSDLSVTTYTDSGLSSPTANSISFSDSGGGVYAESGATDDVTGWQVVSSVTAGYSVSGPIGIIAVGFSPSKVVPGLYTDGTVIA